MPYFAFMNVKICTVILYNLDALGLPGHESRCVISIFVMTINCGVSLIQLPNINYSLFHAQSQVF